MEPSSRQLVLLGASNLTRGVGALVGAGLDVFGSPLRILCAIGHGRSYGDWSRVLVRSLPGIEQCGLWRELDPSAETYALVADVGNDVMYGYEPDRIVGWVHTCLARLEKAGARVLVVLPPMRRLARLRPSQYHLVATFLFPGRGMSFATAMSRVADLDRGLRALADEHTIDLLEPDPAWYGLDPIHIRRSLFGEVFPALLARLSGRTRVSSPARLSPLRWASLRSARAERWRLCGVGLGSAQPARRLADGTTVAWY